MKKRIFAFMLALTLALAAVPALAEGESTEQEPSGCEHSAGRVYTKIDDTYHQMICEECNAVIEQQKHQWENGKCILCGAEEKPAEPANGENSGESTGGEESVEDTPDKKQSGANGIIMLASNAGDGSGTGGTGTGDEGGTGTGAGDGTGTGDGGGTGTGAGDGAGTGDGGDTGTGAGDGAGTGDGGGTGTDDAAGDGTGTEQPTHTHAYAYSWSSWTCSNGSHKITYTRTCTVTGCGDSATIDGDIYVEDSTIVRCNGRVYCRTTYGAKAKFTDETSTNICTTPHICDRLIGYDCCDWYYNPCYYQNSCGYYDYYNTCGPCGHYGCGDVCSRYSSCASCNNYAPVFRVGGYSCLATPKTGDMSAIGIALASLLGAGAAIIGKKRK